MRQALAAPVGIDSVEKCPAADSEAECGVGIPAREIAQLGVRVDAGVDEAERGMLPGEVIPVEPEGAESAGPFLAVQD